MSKKPRGDSKLKTLLNDEQQKKLYEFLRANSYEKGVAFAQKEFELSTSVSALLDFFHWFPLTRRLEEAKTFAEQLKSDLKNAPGLNLTDDQLSQAAQRAFEIKALKDDDPKIFWMLRMNSLSQRKLVLAENELALKRDKFEFSAAELVLKHADKVRPIADGPGTNDEKIKQLRDALFGDLEATS